MTSPGVIPSNIPNTNNILNIATECNGCGSTGQTVCKDCSGDGELIAGRGSGSSVNQQSINNYYSKHNKRPPCRSCGGSGTVRHGSCSGTGRIGNYY
jgi:hypothetical protein